MARSNKQESGEWLQIATLTFAMTGGGFALVLLLLKFFMIPGAQAEADRAQKSYGDLVKLLQDSATKDLRATAKRTEGVEQSGSLGELIKKAGDDNGIKFPTIPVATVKGEEHRIKITSDPAKLQDLVNFVAAVLDQKKTIQVETVSFKRDPRAKSADEDSWTCVADFVDYVAKGQ